MTLWLDDIRDPAMHGYIGAVWAKTPEEAIARLSTGQFTRASLDHDMNPNQMFGEYLPGESTGFSVLYWLCKNPRFVPRDGISVHSANPHYAPLMKQFIAEHFA